jgi:hypothetical protein
VEVDMKEKVRKRSVESEGSEESAGRHEGRT